MKTNREHAAALAAAATPVLRWFRSVGVLLPTADQPDDTVILYQTVRHADGREFKVELTLGMVRALARAEQDYRQESGELGDGECPAHPAGPENGHVYLDGRACVWCATPRLGVVP